MTAPNSVCPSCGPCRSDVKDSRPQKMGGEIAVMRRRRCGQCEQMFKTFEVGEAFFNELKTKIRRQIIADLVNDGEPL